MELKVHGALAAVAREAWDGLADEGTTPFVGWSWLEALERSGAVTPRTGWQPCHLTLWRGARLVAAAPAYLKQDSDGDFARDWGWAEAAARARIRYYPKLILGVPFTPVTGRRLLVAPGEDRAACVEELVAGARRIATGAGATSIHVLFPDAREAAELASTGLERRVSIQYHWRNQGYGTPEEFLARFDSKHRNQARRERGEPGRQGIAIRTVRGDELGREPRIWAEAAFRLYRSTVDKLMWGRRWLNQAFYHLVFERMPERLEMVEARRQGRLVAGAFNVATPARLYGRYWGCLEEHRFLHFNVCYYHSIDECIRRSVGVFEGGAGGEHKIARGFEPVETYSAHAFLDPRLDVPLRAYIAEEAAARQRALEEWRSTSPLLKTAAQLRQDR